MTARRSGLIGLLALGCLPLNAGDQAPCEANADCPGFNQVCVDSLCFQASDDWTGAPPTDLCGNGNVDGDEECDDGDQNTQLLPNRCRMNCRQPLCGDGITDRGEQCDDANDTATDGCDNCLHRSILTTGGAQTCLIRNQGELWCWGADAKGALAILDQSGVVAQPTPVPNGRTRLTDVAQVTTGQGSTCLIQKIQNGSGRLLCSGKNDHGQLGDGTTTDRRSFLPIDGLEFVDDIALFHQHACAIASNQVVCWGNNEACQSGRPSGQPILAPWTHSELPQEPKQIVTGQRQSCAVWRDGSAKCWGSVLEQATQNGGGTWSCTAQAMTILTDIEQICAGSNYRCARDSDGLAWCWGKNWNGVLGVGDDGPDYATEPQQVLGLQGVSRLSCGAEFACAIINDGSAWCWGKNNAGQLGDGSRIDRSEPVRVLELSHVTAIAAGFWHTCAQQRDGSVWCWGSNEFYQLGNDQISESLQPVEVLFSDD